MSRAVTATIHMAALAANLARVRALAPAAKIMAVVKADGYGHGLERVARALAATDAFGVASLQDGQRLRAAGFRQRIVVLSGFDEPGDVPELTRLALEPVIHHESQLDLLERAADRRALPRPLWIEVDTGMHRLGFPVRDLDAVRARLSRLGIGAEHMLLMSHFANSDVAADPINARQLDTFATLGNAHAIEPGLTSRANSAALLNFASARDGWVRPGGLLYGISVLDASNGADFGFAPAMTLSTRLIAINAVPAGDAIGYAGTYTATRDMRVGIAAAGYGDGYPRDAPSGTPVLIADAPAPIVGRVSMDLIAIDVTHLADARVGSRVTLWGRGLPVETIARAAGTIGYELTCGMTRRVAFVEDHAPVDAHSRVAENAR